MKLTDRTKKEFEEWKHNLYNKWVHDDKKGYENYGYSKFNELPPSMQYGVLVDYFDSVGIHVEISLLSYKAELVGKEYNWWIGEKSGSVNDFTGTSRQKARTKAIEKANEIRNEQLK